MTVEHNENVFIDIAVRLLGNGDAPIPVETARWLMGCDFGDGEKARMRELSAKARAGTLSNVEEAEADFYEKIANILNMLQSKARQSLK